MAVDMVAAFTEQMAQLRQALAAADPQTAGPASLPAAQVVAGTFASAPEAERLRFLLRALDDAIATQEIAARLADELHGAGILEFARAPQDGEADPLHAAYQAYAESQPAFAALYQYRNALALRLRVTARPIPDTIGGAQQPETSSPAEKPATKPRRRRKDADK